MGKETHSVYLPIQGLNTSAPAEYITDQNSPSVENVVVEDSVIKTRIGDTTLGSLISGTNIEILGGIEFNRNGIDILMRVGSDKAQKWDSGSSDWLPITTGSLSLSNTDEISFCSSILSGERIGVFTSAGLAPQKYIGSGVHEDLGGTPPKAKFCESFGAYTLLANITDDGGNAYRNRVQWCDTGLPESWTGGNSGYTDLYESSDLTGIKRFGNYVTVHTPEIVYLGYLVSSSSIFKFDAKYTPGTISNTTIQMLPNGFLCYLSRDGIRVFNGANSQRVTGPINDWLKRSVNFPYAYLSQSIVNAALDEYWCAIPIGDETLPTTIIRYNYETNTLIKDTLSHNLRSMFLFSNTIDLTWDQDLETWDEAVDTWDNNTSATGFKNIVLNSDKGYSYMRDSAQTSDHGNQFVSKYESKDFRSDVDGELLRWLQIEVWAKGSSVKVAYSIDSGYSWTEITEFTLSDDYPSDDSPLVGYYDVVSSKIRFKFYSESNFELKQYTIRYNKREQRSK